MRQTNVPRQRAATRIMMPEPQSVTVTLTVHLCSNPSVVIGASSSSTLAQRKHRHVGTASSDRICLTECAMTVELLISRNIRK